MLAKERKDRHFKKPKSHLLKAAFRFTKVDWLSRIPFVAHAKMSVCGY
jgi:hypothetical protein